jgi:predicted permease
MAPPDLPRIGTVHVNLRVMLFAFGATCMVGMLFGIIPAASLSKARLLDRMGSTRVTSSGRARLHSMLVALQLALAMLLLGGAGLLVHTMRALNRVDPGFHTDHLLAIELYPRYGDFKTPEAGDAYYNEIRDAIARTPGVTDVAFSSFLPFTGDQASNTVTAEGYTPAKGEIPDATRHYVSGNYFSLMRMRIVDGRALAPSDDHANGPHIAVVGEQFAKHFWPGRSAVGKTFEHWSNKFTVVGVVADSKDRTLDEPGDILDFYMPQGPEGSALGDAFLVKTSVEPASLVNAIRKNIWSVDKDLPITRIQPMTEIVAATITAQRYRATLITSFAVLSLLFSLLGVYGVVSRAVSGRMREMGLRLALGARPQSLVFMVLAQGMRLAVVGLITGVVALAAATKVLSAFLFDTKPLDPMAIGTVSLILLVLTAAAVLPPSLRAARAVALNALRAPD